MSETISTREAARRLHISRATVVRLIRAGAIRAAKKTRARNSPYLVDAASVEAYDRARRQP